MLHRFPTRAEQRSFLSHCWLPILLMLLAAIVAVPSFAQSREDEIIANLAGGRVIVHVARDLILFAAIDQPLERNSISPRVMNLDARHIGILLGASEWRVFSAVALPLAWPGVLAGTILSFARALGEFGATLMIAGNIPGRTETIPIAIYFAVEADDIQRALYWCGVDVIISLALLSGLYLWTRTQGLASARRPAH